MSVRFDPEGNVVVGGRIAGNFDPTVGAPSPADAGAPAQDGFVAKFDADGTLVWLKRWSSAQGGGIVLALAVDALGNVVVSGIAEGELDVDGGTVAPQPGEQMACAVAKYDAAGGLLWHQPRYAEAIQVDRSGSALLLTSNSPMLVGDVFLTKLDAGGAEIFSKRVGYGAMSVVLGTDVDGRSVVFGNLTMGDDAATGTVGVLHATVAKLDANGGVSWERELRGTGLIMADAAALDEHGAVTISGHFSDTLDVGGSTLSGPTGDGAGSAVFVARYDATGALLWARRYGESPRAQNASSAIAFGPDDTMFLSGDFAGTIDFGLGVFETAGVGDHDAFVVEIDRMGQTRASSRFGDSALKQGAQSVAADFAGHVALTGSFDGTIDFGSGPLVWAQPRQWTAPNDLGLDGFVAVLAR